MAVKRIVANIATPQLEAAHKSPNTSQSTSRGA